MRSDLTPTEEEQSEGEPLLQYFFFVGPNKKNPKKLKRIKGKVHSSYSIEGNSQEYGLLKDIFKTDINLYYNVFPCKADYLDKLNFEDKVQKGVFVDYCGKTEQDPFFHCFIYKFWQPPQYFDWYFNCFVFWEAIDKSIDIKEEDTTYYIAHAMVIVTRNSYFSLCKQILEYIYKVMKQQSLLVKKVDPMEPFIINLFRQLVRSQTDKIDISINKEIEYKITGEKFLPLCDLNLHYFFQMFSITDILFIAEQFFRRRTIMIISPRIENLYPFYHILMTLLYPLNITDNTYLYRLLTPEIVHLLNDFQLFFCIYADKIPSGFIEMVTKASGDIVCIEITKKAYSDAMPTYLMSKAKYTYRDGTVELTAFTDKSIVYDIIKGANNELYFSFLENAFKSIQPSNSSSIFAPGSYDEIRRLFFGLMNKFFVLIIPKITFSISDTSIIIESEENKLKKYKDFIDEFFSTPSYDIIIKERVDINCPNLKDLILADELLKILQIDPNRVYYDFKSVDLEAKSSTPTSTTPDPYQSMLLRRESIVIKFTSVDSNNKMHYLNEYNKRILRREAKEYLITYYNRGYYINYKSITFDFNIFPDKSLSLKAKPHDILLMELETMLDLLNTQTIPITENIQIASATICLGLCLIALNTPLKIDTFKIYLFMLFNFTEGFYRRFNALLSLLYEVIIQDQSLIDQYMKNFFLRLKNLEMIPTFSIYLKYNNQKAFNMKQSGEKSELSLSFIQSGDQSGKSCHNLIEGMLNKNFRCEKCGNPYIFLTHFRSGGESESMLINPLIILKRMMKNVLLNRSVFLNDINDFYAEWFDDLCQIAFLFKLYFKMDLFQ